MTSEADVWLIFEDNESGGEDLLTIQSTEEKANRFVDRLLQHKHAKADALTIRPWVVDGNEIPGPIPQRTETPRTNEKGTNRVSNSMPVMCQWFDEDDDLAMICGKPVTHYSCVSFGRIENGFNVCMQHKCRCKQGVSSPKEERPMSELDDGNKKPVGALGLAPYAEQSEEWRAGYDEAEAVYHAKQADLRRQLRKQRHVIARFQNAEEVLLGLAEPDSLNEHWTDAIFKHHNLGGSQSEWDALHAAYRLGHTAALITPRAPVEGDMERAWRWMLEHQDGGCTQEDLVELMIWARSNPRRAEAAGKKQ